MSQIVAIFLSPQSEKAVTEGPNLDQSHRQFYWSSCLQTLGTEVCEEGGLQGEILQTAVLGMQNLWPKGGAI